MGYSYTLQIRGFQYNHWNPLIFFIAKNLPYFLNSFFKILPVALMGNDGKNSIWRGYL